MVAAWLPQTQAPSPRHSQPPYRPPTRAAGRRSPCCSRAPSWSCSTSSSSTSPCRRSRPTSARARARSSGWSPATGSTFAALLITAGRLGDLFGRRRVYAIGLGLFTLTSLACGLAPSPTALVVARVAQGASAAILMPQVLSTIAVTYRGDDHARALAIYGMVLGLARRRRAADRRRAGADRLPRPGLARLLPDQRADRTRRAGRCAAAGA